MEKCTTADLERELERQQGNFALLSRNIHYIEQDIAELIKEENEYQKAGHY